MTADSRKGTSQPGPWASVAEGATPAPLSVEQVGVPENLLDGGEIVLLAIKPSVWSVGFTSMAWICTAVVVAAMDIGSGLSRGWLAGVPVAELALTVAAARAGWAMLQWVSQVYVLTNRRIMRIRGVLSAQVFGCPLVKIINTGVTCAPHEAALRLGSLWFNIENNAGDPTWYHLSRPEEVHAKVRQAIRRALDASS